MIAPSRPVIIGHRGASGYRPEHSASAYRLAFALGADFVEPDLVVSSDGVLVLRHENDITDTTDVASRPEFAGRRTVRMVDGERHDGWFTEDFTWAELATLHCRERLPELRAASATYNNTERLLCLADLIQIINECSLDAGRALGMVAEIKHSTYFAERGFIMEDLLREQLAGWNGGGTLVVESFELGVLERLRASGLEARYVYLLDKTGIAEDERPEHGGSGTPYAEMATPAGLRALAGRVHGISLSRAYLVAAGGRELVEAAHALGLDVFTWTLRPENRFLAPAARSSEDPAEFGDWRTEFAQIIRTGVDGIFVDHPDLGRLAREHARAGISAVLA